MPCSRSHSELRSDPALRSGQRLADRRVFRRHDVNHSLVTVRLATVEHLLLEKEGRRASHDFGFRFVCAKAEDWKRQREQRDQDFGFFLDVYGVIASLAVQ